MLLLLRVIIIVLLLMQIGLLDDGFTNYPTVITSSLLRTYTPLTTHYYKLTLHNLLFLFILSLNLNSNLS